MPPYIFGKLNLAAFLEGVRYRRVHYGRLYCIGLSRLPGDRIDVMKEGDAS
jgi:hypothetical protein